LSKHYSHIVGKGCVKVAWFGRLDDRCDEHLVAGNILLGIVYYWASFGCHIEINGNHSQNLHNDPDHHQ
jgi:hypothetical protein